MNLFPLVLLGGVAALALAGRKRKAPEPELQPYAPQDECDPLDPATWPDGMLCVPWEGRWVAVPEWSPPPTEEATADWPCAHFYNGYCIEVWDGLAGQVVAVGPAHAFKWRISTPDGELVKEWKPMTIWSYYDSAWEALAAAYDYIDAELT